MKWEICILAGGLSRRMGRDKARLPLGAATMLERIRQTARQTGWPVRVIRRDLTPRCGPLGGVVTALTTTKADGVLFLACDMPFITTELLLLLVQKSGAGRAAKTAVFTRAADRFGFPFALRPTDLPAARRLLKERAYSLQALAKALSAQPLRLPPKQRGSIINVNTPAEHAQAQKKFMDPNEQLILDAQGLGMWRGEVRILKDVSWQIRPGEHWAMLGANGSGKTSLLAALTGYMTPSCGTIRVLGKEFGRADWRELRKSIGIVSSSIRQLMPETESALETVASGKDAMIDRWGPLTRHDKARARELLARTGCGHLEKRAWAWLSQGERQRVLIGRALMASPALLILDEPCAGLDPAAREHFLSSLDNITAGTKGPSVVLVTHHVEEIVPGITHVLALKDGAVAGTGAKRQVLTSKNISEIFSCPARLTCRAGRYSIRLTGQPVAIL